MDSLLQSLQARILPEDVALLADGNGIKALSVNEVLAITHAIDHQLSMMKRGVLGSDIVGFVQHLLSTGELDPNTFPRSPTPIELQLCRKLARIEDSDIVTQLQILRMLDVFRILVVLFQRNVLSMIEDELGSNNNNGNKSSSNKPSGGKNNKRSIGGGARTSSAQKRHVSQQSNAIPEDVAARIDLATDVCASAAALTDDTLFATSYGGMIPTYVLYQVAERYGLDARSCFHPHSAISMLPTSDDAVLALRDIKAREDEQKRRLAAGNGKKSSSPRGDAKQHPGGSDGSDDDALGDETLNSTTGGAAVAAAAEQQRRKASTTLQKNTVVPVEFISPVVLTDTFTPLDKKLLRVFTETFGAYDPNDPHNQFGLSEDLVDGHYLRILPIPKFAHVLRISLMRATKVIQHALEGVAAGATGRGAGGALGTVGSASVRRRSQRHGNDAISTGGDDVEDLFGVWGSDAAAANGGSTGSVGQRSLSPVSGHILGGKKMSFVSEAAMSARSPPPPAGVNANSNSNTLANSQRGNNNHDNNNTNSVAAEALPSPFHVVIARGYLRYPEFELIIRFLNQDASASSDQASGLKEAQQYLVDELVARNSNTQLASGKGASSLTSAASPQQSEQARQLGAAASRQRGVFAPSGEDEQRLIDGQATFIDRMLFAPDGTLKLTVNTANGGLSTAGGASARKSGKFVRGIGAADIVSPTNGGDEERRFPGGAPDASGVALVVSPTSGSSPADGDAGATAASAGGGGGAGEKRHSTVTVNLQRSHRASHHRHGSPSSPTGSTTTTSGAPLHGWAIHEHHADRLATNPMNGRDVNRMRKSFVSSSDRTTHSYTTSNTATGQLQQTLDAPPASSGSGGAAGGPSGAPNSGVLSSTQVAQPMQRRVVSPRQRQLMEVLNLEKMAEVMDRIPDDPLGLFAGSLLGGGGTAGSGVGGVGVGGVQQGANNGGTNAGGPQSLLSPSGIGGASGAGGGAPSHLSIAALLNHTDSSLAAAYFGGPGGNGSLSTGGGAYALEVDLLDPSGSSKRSGGTRGGTKASCKNTSHGEGGGGMLVSPTLLGASSRHQRLLSSSGQGDDDLSISQNPYDVTVSAPDAAVAIHPAGDGSAPLSRGAGAANGGAPADGTARTRTHNKVPLRSTGIHERDWRSVHYIPKLDNDSIGDYCHNTKRSGGGFGERGRPTAPTGAEGGGDAASTSSRRQRRQYPKSDSGHAAPKVSAEDDSVVPGGQQSHGNPTDKLSSAVSSRSTRDNNSQTQAKPQQLDTSGGGNQQPSPTHVRKVPKKPLPLVSPRTAAATRDPDAEVKHMPRAPAPPQPRRLHDGPSSSRTVPVEPSSLTASTNTTKAKSARQAAPSSQSVVPPPRGFMAVMDASRQPHGGTMLSFIPSALAMDVVRSIDLRHTFPNAGGGGRHSVRGSLLEPLGQGNRGAAEPLEAVRDPLHDAAMARSREQMGKLRYAS